GNRVNAGTQAPAEECEGCGRGDCTATTELTCFHKSPLANPSLRPAAAGRQGRATSRVRDLKDAVADLLAQDELRILRDAQQDLVELDLTAAGDADHAPLAQQVDEVLEHGAVEELRRVQPVQQSHALRGQLAASLEVGLGNLAAAGL